VDKYPTWPLSLFMLILREASLSLDFPDNWP